MSGTSFDMTGARRELARLVEGLKDAASGAVVERAAAKVQSQIDSVSKAKLSQHVASGDALATADTTHSGGLIQIRFLEYLNYGKPWWPFRGGKMPPFVITNARRIFAGELEAAISGKPSPIVLAEEAAEASAAAKSSAQFKKEIAKIYRGTAEGKAARRAEAKKRRAEGGA